MTKITLFGIWVTFLAISLNFLASSASAQNSTTMTDEDVYKFMSQYLVELDEPYLVFHWFDATPRDPIWQTPLSAASSSGLDHVRTEMRHFWQALCGTDAAKNAPDCDPPSAQRYGRGGMAGPGLYVSIDPIATNSYGGLSPVLLQITLPKKFRIFDFGFDQGSIPSDIRDYLNQTYQCQATSIAGFIYMGTNYGYQQMDNCFAFARKFIKERLKLDGYMYGYRSSQFKGCGAQVTQSKLTDTLKTRGPFTDRAMVLIDDSKLKADDVKILTAKTPDGLYEKETMKFFVLYSYSGNPSLDVLSTGQVNYKNGGSVYQNGAPYGANPAFKWDDMPVLDYDEASMAAWMKKNIIGCQDKPPYVPINK